MLYHIINLKDGQSYIFYNTLHLNNENSTNSLCSSVPFVSLWFKKMVQQSSQLRS